MTTNQHQSCLEALQGPDSPSHTSAAHWAVHLLSWSFEINNVSYLTKENHITASEGITARAGDPGRSRQWGSQPSALHGQNPFDQGLADKCNLLHLESAQGRDVWMPWEQDTLALQWHFAAPVAFGSGFWSTPAGTCSPPGLCPYFSLGWQGSLLPR